MTEDANEEAAWRDLVAHYATPAAADGAPAPWPTREDLPAPAPQGPAADPDASGPDTADLDVSGLDMAGPENPEADGTQLPGPRLGPRPGPFGGLQGPPQIRIVRPASAAPPPSEDDDHFVPPVPPPLPRLDSVTKGAWVALFGGPAYLVIATAVGWSVPGIAAFFAVAAFVTGFAILVLRMNEPGPGGPDDGDDGAVV